MRIVDAPGTPGFCFCKGCLADLDGGHLVALARRMLDTFRDDIPPSQFWSWHTVYCELAQATDRRPLYIETASLRLPADDAAGLRDFIQRAEADLANPSGLSQTWPAFAADVRRAVALARARLGEGAA